MESFVKINDIVGSKANLNSYKRIETLPYILSDHSRIKLESSRKTIEMTQILAHFLNTGSLKKSRRKFKEKYIQTKVTTK